jgi:hypothetical protein
MVLNSAQTWHQVRPGELRTNCGGCHAHSQLPLEFESTAASLSSHQIFDLSQQTPIIAHDAQGDPILNVLAQSRVDVEFLRDIRPLLVRSCIGCHTATDPDPPGDLVLDDYSLQGGLPGDYRRLAEDTSATHGYPPVIANGSWRQTNASRYVRRFQARRSLLTWKVYGERLDGWSNEDHPTEATPGDASTLPAGAEPNEADLDFTGSIMPPPGSGVPLLSDDEKLLFARWIDLGAPIDTAALDGNDGFGWFLDDLRPTLAVSLPRPGYNPTPITSLRIGLADANSGIDIDSFSLRADFSVEGRPPGNELSDLSVDGGNGIWELFLSVPVGPMIEGHLWVEIQDNQGNTTRVDRRFATLADGIFVDGFESGDTTHWGL